MGCRALGQRRLVFDVLLWFLSDDVRWRVKQQFPRYSFATINTRGLADSRVTYNWCTVNVLSPSRSSLPRALLALPRSYNVYYTPLPSHPTPEQKQHTDNSAILRVLALAGCGGGIGLRWHPELKRLICLGLDTLRQPVINCANYFLIFLV